MKTKDGLARRAATMIALVFLLLIAQVGPAMADSLEDAEPDKRPQGDELPLPPPTLTSEETAPGLTDPLDNANTWAEITEANYIASLPEPCRHAIESGHPHLIFAPTIDGKPYWHPDHPGGFAEANRKPFGISFAVGVVFIGSVGSDFFTGSRGSDLICTGDAVDFVFGWDGDDVVFLGDGDDYIQAGPGDDLIFGGEGDDDLYGEWGADRLLGESGEDTIEGGAGHDVLCGGDDDDELRGQGGNDELFGGDGSDDLQGGLGANKLHGTWSCPAEVAA